MNFRNRIARRPSTAPAPSPLVTGMRTYAPLPADAWGADTDRIQRRIDEAKDRMTDDEVGEFMRRALACAPDCGCRGTH